MKNAVKWLFAHEPAILAGLIAAGAVVAALCYGSKADAVVQWLSGGTVLGVFGTLRNFVTSPAGRQALDTAQADISQLPRLIADVNQAKAVLGPVLAHPAGIVGLLDSHLSEVRKVTGDTVHVVRGMLRANAPVVPAEPVVTAPAAPAEPVAPDLPPEIAALAPTSAAPQTQPAEEPAAVS